MIRSAFFAGMPGYTIDLAHGPRSAEEVVLSRVRELRRDATAAGSPLAAPPLWIVVPSRSLRLHLLRRLAARGGPEISLGVRCATAYGIAAELAEISGATRPDLLTVLAERFAREEKALRALATLSDGYAIVAAAVRDLLDAGFDPAHLDGLLEALEQPEARSAGHAACDRAAALLRVAARVDRACEEGEVPARYRVYRRAANAVLGARGPSLQAVVVHGFAEATGVVCDLLEALLKTYGGSLILDRPHDPFTSGRLAGDGKFTKRLIERLQGASSSLSDASDKQPAPRPRLIVAARPEVEVEDVAHRILDMIAAGRAPEEIGVVMRDPGPYRLTLRRRFDALGVPFSAAGVTGASLPHRRRLTSLLALLEEGPRMPVERWLELLPVDFDAIPSDLALALAARGAGRLETAAALPDDTLHGELPVRLPGRRARAIAEESEESGEAHEEREEGSEATPDGDRSHPEIPRSALRRAVERARATVDALERLHDRQPLRGHLEALRCLVDEALAWRPEDPARRELAERVFVTAAELPPGWELDCDELRRLLTDLLADAGRQELGGAGGGVRVLDVVAARAHTFDHLFLLGMQRGRFPRQVREDPLLPDAVREALATHGFGPLPDLPRKRTGHDEEAHLFAQLLAAAPEVSLSWSRADADGNPLSPSPWIDRMRGGMDLEPVKTPPVWGKPAADDDAAARRLARRPAEEWLRLAGLHGSRGDVARLLLHAVAAVREDASEAAASLARARLAILDELDPDLDSRRGLAAWRGLGPFSGLVGPTAKPDSVSDENWVTRHEAMACCPWQHFLEHTLRLEAWPDPLTDLPALDAALVGSFVHAVLHRLFVGGGAPGETTVAGAVAAGASEIPWPAPAAVARLATAVAREVLAHEGIHLAGFTDALVVRGLPMIERAHALLWEQGAPAILGSELTDTVEVAGAGIAFRADLAVQEAAGVRFVDFKTGAPLADKSRESTRRRHLLAAIARGDALQVAVYATSRTAGRVAGGAYLYLTDRDVTYPEARRMTIDTNDSNAPSLLADAIARLSRARSLGLHPPRLNQPPPDDDRVPPACGWCAVRQACHQGDSTARIRQRRWVDRHQALSRIDDPMERAFAALWWMRDPGWSARQEEGEA